MSYQTAKWYPLAGKEGIFGGGYVDNVSQYDMNPRFSPYLRNARLDGQSPIIRPGYDLLSTLAAGDYPRGIGSYLRAVEADSRLIVRHNISATEKLYAIDTAGALTPITTASNIASDNKMRFVNVGEVIYCMNGSDNYGKLSGTTYTIPSTGIANFAPKFGVVFNSSMFVAGWSTNPGKVYKSVGDNYDDYSSAGSDNFSFIEQITGLSANSEALFYFTKNTISVTGYQDIVDTAGTLSYNTRPLTVKEGAVNHDCIAELGTNVYYLSSSNSINMIARGNNINGFEVLELSDRKYSGISKILGGIDKDQSNAFAVVYPNEMLIKWFLYSQGSTYADICVVYDSTKDAFLIDEQKYFTDGVYFRGQNYTTSAIEPKVFIDEYGQSDEDTPISFEYHTKEFYAGDAIGKKILRESRGIIDMNELAEPMQELYVDGALFHTKNLGLANIPMITGGIGTYPTGTEAIGIEGGNGSIGYDDEYFEVPILITKGDLNVKGRKFQWRYKNTTLGGKVRLKSIEAKIEGLPAETTNLTP